MSQIPIALQLYSVRQECHQDLEGTLKKIAEMGYDGVEFAGYYGRTAKELRTMLDDFGLQVAGSHIQLDKLLDEDFEDTVEFNTTLGNRFLIVPGLSEERTASIDAWKRTADLFNTVSERLAPFGMITGYHNHVKEFAPLEGKIPWEVFFDHTLPAVSMQLDTGNALAGGCDGIAYIEKYPGRSKTVHLKEYGESYDTTVIGEGNVDWPRLFQLCKTIGGTRWYIVEQENEKLDALETVRRCIKNLRSMGK